MTADQLIAEARAHRTGRVDPPTLEALERALRLTLEHLLESTDLEVEPAGLPAQVARILATVLANIEDQRPH